MVFNYNGSDMYYEIKGEGKPILFLHGWGTNIESFVPVIASLSKEFKTIAVDFPGFGKSAEPEGVWGVSDYTDVIESFIMEMGFEKIDIIAHSFGGRVTILLANRIPGRIGKIVICDGAGVLPKRGLDYYIKVYSYKIAKKLFKLFGAESAGRLKRAGSEDYRRLNENMRATFIRVVNEDLTKYLKNIKNPVLLVWGEKDETTPLYMAKIMENELDDAGLVVFEGAGHYAFLDDMPRFCKIVSYFFGGNS